MLRKIMHLLFIITFGLIATACGGTTGSSNDGGGGGDSTTPTVTMLSPNPTTNVPFNNLGISLYVNTPVSLPNGSLPSGAITLTGPSGSIAITPSVVNGTSSALIAIYPESLVTNTQYTLAVSSSLTSQGGVPVTPVNFTFTTSAQPGLSETISSPSSMTNVATNTSIQITASYPLVASTCTSSNVTLSAGSNNVAGSVACNGAVLTFTPSSALASNTTYTFKLGSGLQGIQDGVTYNQLNPQSFSFTTGSQLYSIANNATGVTTLLSSSGDGSWTTNLVATNFIQAITSSNDSLVLAGANGAVSTNSQLSKASAFAYMKVSPTAPATSSVIQYATDGQGNIVGVQGAGNTFVVISHDNGLTWDYTNLTPGAGTGWQTIAYGNGTFVMLDNGGATNQGVAISTDGRIWNQYAVTVTTPNSLANLVFANGIFVFVNGVANSPVVYSSANPVAAANWTAGTGVTLTSCGTVNNVNVTIGFGTAGTTTPAPYWVFGCAAAGGATTTLATTPAGISGMVISNTATYQTTVTSNYLVRNITNVASTGQFIIGTNATSGASGIQYLNINGTGAPSTLATSIVVPAIGSIACSTGYCAATSTAGTAPTIYQIAIPATPFVATNNWSQASVTPPPYATAYAFTTAPNGVGGIVVSNDNFIAVGGNVAFGGFAVSAPATEAPTSWTYRPTGSVSVAMQVNAMTSTYFNSVKTLIAVGNGGSINKSIDNGISWTPVAVTGLTANLNAIACGSSQGSNICVVGGAGGVVYTTTDGNEFTSRTSNTPGNIVSIAYGAGSFVAITSATTYNVITSNNGTFWNTVNSISATNTNVNVVYANVNNTPTFVIATNTATTGNIYYNNTLTSNGANSFSQATTGTLAANNVYTSMVYTIVNGKGEFVAVGGQAATGWASAVSEDGISWTVATGIVPANPFLNITSSPSEFYVNTATQLYSSNDGQQWNVYGAVLANTSLNTILFANGIMSGITNATAANGFNGAVTYDPINGWQNSTNDQEIGSTSARIFAF